MNVVPVVIIFNELPLYALLIKLASHNGSNILSPVNNVVLFVE